MKKFDDWLSKNERKVYLFMGAVLIALAVNNPIVAGAVYYLGLAIIPKED